MFYWTDESINWYMDAVSYTGCIGDIYKQIKEFFHKEDIVYDLGCGIGALDIKLAPHVAQIIGIDIEERVVDVLRQQAERMNYTNVVGRVADWSILPKDCCDTVLMCSFGTLEKDLDRFMKICKKRLVVLKRNTIKQKNGFVTSYSQKNGANIDELYLDKKGITYKSKDFFSDFGQPFRDWEDARKFIEHYDLVLGEDCIDIEDYMKRYLQAVDGTAFQWYLPNEKYFRVMIIEKEDYCNWENARNGVMQNV